MKQTHYKQRRNRDFIALCRAISAARFREGRTCTLTEIIDEALGTPPRAHYVEFDYACRILRRIEKVGLRRLAPEGPTRDKWAELSDQVAEAMNGPRRLPFASAVAYVLTFCRPSRHYFGPSTARKILSKHFEYTAVFKDRC